MEEESEGIYIPYEVIKQYRDDGIDFVGMGYIPNNDMIHDVVSCDYNDLIYFDEYLNTIIF